MFTILSYRLTSIHNGTNPTIIDPTARHLILGIEQPIKVLIDGQPTLLTKNKLFDGREILPETPLNESVNILSYTLDECPNGIAEISFSHCVSIQAPSGCFYPRSCDHRFPNGFMRVSTDSDNASYMDINKGTFVPLGHFRGGKFGPTISSWDYNFFHFDRDFKGSACLSYSPITCSPKCNDVDGNQCSLLTIKSINYTWEQFMHIWIVTIIIAAAILGILLYLIVKQCKRFREIKSEDNSMASTISEPLL